MNKVSSPNNIAERVIRIGDYAPTLGDYAPTLQAFVQNFAALVFAAMRGPASITAAATNIVRHLYVPGPSRMTHEDHLNFLEDPVANLNMLARHAQVSIQVRFDDPPDGAPGGVIGGVMPWNDWISVAKEVNGISVRAMRIFEKGQVISVFCGERIWNSGVAYRDDYPAYEEGVPPAGEYGYVGRSPDGTLGVFDAESCPLFMAVQFIERTSDPKVANCFIDELGIVSAARRIGSGDRLSRLLNHFEGRRY